MPLRHLLQLAASIFVISSATPSPLAPTINTSTRAQLIDTLFGLGKGVLPSEKVPAEVISVEGPSAKGCYCAYFGECDVSSCQWGNNMTKIIWNIRTKVNDTFTLDLNSTIIYTLNTSGAAPQIHDGAGVSPEIPGGGWFGNESNSGGEALYPQGIGDTLVLFHHGHSRPCDYAPPLWLDQAQDWLNQLGYDVMSLSMPLHQLNYHKESLCDHKWFEQFEKQGVKTIGRYFLEPVVRTINYATETLGYKRIIMMGLSGGGWTTTLMSAIDTRIQLSIPVAGSIPCSFPHTSWDYEQYCTNDWAQVCDYECLYALAGLEPSRYSVQIIHEKDPCCFHGYGRHDGIREYNARVQQHIQGHFETVPTVGNVHQVNVRDKAVAAALIDRLRTHGELTTADFESMPYNTLKQW
jgi:hypothetical protein